MSGNRRSPDAVVSLNEVVDVVSAIRAGKFGVGATDALGNKLYCTCDGAVCGCDGNHCTCNVVSGGPGANGSAADFEAARTAQLAALKARLEPGTDARDEAE